MLEVCFSCESKISAQVRSATVVLTNADLTKAKVDLEKIGLALSLKGTIMPDGSIIA